MYTNLIECDQLRAILSGPERRDNIVIFDCRHDLMNPDYGKNAYSEKHIVGALFASIDDDLSTARNGNNGRHPLPTREKFCAWLGENGVDNNTQVIAYDDAGGVYGSRLWWMLRWVGHEACAVLHGGIKAWEASNGDLTSIPCSPTKTSIFDCNPRDIAVDVVSVIRNINTKEMLVVDARANDRFHGKNEMIDPVGGHIPGAVNRFFKNNLDEQGRFLPADELRKAFLDLAGTMDTSSLIHQCGSGVSACHNILAMDIAGLAPGKLYPGSWSEWVSDDQRPVATD